MRDDFDRAAILARRKRFLAAALASVGGTPGLALAAGESPDGAAETPSATPVEAPPRICLSDDTIEGRLPPPEPPRPPGPPPHVCLSIVRESFDRPHRHDGFSLRMGPIAGVLSMSVTASDTTRSADAGAFGGELAAGFTLGGGLVLGLGATALHAPSPSAGFRSLDVWQLGPWLDYYPDPSAGWHGMLTLAPQVLVARESAGTSRGVGIGGSLWLGYDAWIGSEWSTGIALGGAFAVASGKRDDTSVVLRARALTLAASLLFH